MVSVDPDARPWNQMALAAFRRVSPGANFVTANSAETAAQFLNGGGDIGARLRRFDWSAHPLGDPASWPQALKTAIRLMLTTRHPVQIFWGPDYFTFYNDSFAQSLGPEKHPSMLGASGRVMWAEVWPLVGADLEAVMAGQGATWREDQLVPILRHGRLDEVYWTYSYSPIDHDGGVGGVLILVTETTRRVLDLRQRQSERDRQRRLFEQAPGFIIIMRGPDHVVEFVNDAHREVFGSHDWPDKPIRQAFPSIAGQGFYEQLDTVYSTGRTFEAHAAPVKFRRGPAGPEETRYLTFIYAPLHDVDGAISGIFCEGFDVTDAQTAQNRTAALAELGSHVRQIDDADELAYRAAELLGRELGVSRAGYGTIDTARETITIERDWNAPGISSLAGTLNFRDYGSYIDELKRGETVMIDDARLDPRTAGTAGALQAISALSFVNMPVTERGGFVALLYLNHDQPRHWTDDEVAFIREVAERTRTAVERRRAEAAVRRNEARLRFLDALGRETARSTDADAVLAVTTSMLGRHLDVSICAYADMDDDQDGFTIRGDWSAPGSASIVGRYRLAALGRLAVTNLRAGLPLIVNNLAELASEEAATFEALGVVATLCMPLVKDGRLTALMSVHTATPHVWSPEDMALLREVTERSWAHIERVRSEAAVRDGERRFRADLEAQVAERTAALQHSERALQQAQKMEAIGNLTGGVAHDFNNLLMAVLGSLELLRKRMPPEPALLRLLDNAMEGARRGSSLTRRMLAFARRQDLRSDRIDVPTLVGGMTDMMQRSLGPMVAVETRFAPGLSPVETDANQLESALLNLAVNARDAMNGEGQIVIAGREEASEGLDLPPGRYVCLSFTDTGEGMDETTLKRATEPFFTTKEVGKGTGLGLSMVHGLAEQSGGRLVLKSRPGVGTSAEIWLPAKAQPAPSAVTADAQVDPAAVPGRPLTILAVDDDALVLMNTVAMLEDLGHAVEPAYSAREALDLFGQRDFDLVITDHAMPHMTGAQLAAEIRVRRPAIPIILATGYAELPPGTDAGLPKLNKPFMQADLAAAVTRAVSFAG
jgi:signal transduction histidine kinase/PAS domain-containing protein